MRNVRCREKEKKKKNGGNKETNFMSKAKINIVVKNADETDAAIGKPNANIDQTNFEDDDDFQIYGKKIAKTCDNLNKNRLAAMSDVDESNLLIISPSTTRKALNINSPFKRKTNSSIVITPVVRIKNTKENIVVTDPEYKSLDDSQRKSWKKKDKDNSFRTKENNSSLQSYGIQEDLHNEIKNILSKSFQLSDLNLAKKLLAKSFDYRRSIIKGGKTFEDLLDEFSYFEHQDIVIINIYHKFMYLSRFCFNFRSNQNFL